MTTPASNQQEKTCFAIDLGSYDSFRQAVAKDPDQAKFTFRTQTEWIGGAKARTTARSFTITTDEPDALGGSDSAVDPVELLLASASTCVQIGIVTQAARRGIEIQDLSVEAEGDLDVRGYFGNDDVRPGYSQIRYKVRLKADADPATLREIVEIAQRYSPMVDSVANGAPLVADVEVEQANAS